MLDLKGVEVNDPHIIRARGPIASSVLQLITLLKRERPKWKFRMNTATFSGAHTTFDVIYDAEDIGRCGLDSVRTSAGGRTWKFVISAHNILKKTKGDEKRRTERIEAARDLIIENFRPRTPMEIISGGPRGNFHSEANRQNYERRTEIDHVLDTNKDILIDFAGDFAAAEREDRVLTVKPEFRKLINQINDVAEKAKAAEQALQQVSTAVYIWKRTEEWQLIHQDGTDRRYATFEEIPEHIRGKVAVLSIQEIEEDHFEPGVGMKMGGNSFWIFV